MPRLALLVVLVAVVPVVVLAADPSRPYEDLKVIEIKVESQAQLAQLAGKTSHLWSEHAGVGPVMYVVTPDQLRQLEAEGVKFSLVSIDIQDLVDKENPIGARGAFFTAYWELPGIIAYLEGLVAARPDLAQMFVAGTSLEGRDIKGIRITGPGGPGKPAVLLHGLQHAREWITGTFPPYLAEHLITNYDTDPEIQELVDRMEWYLIPAMNPDGYVFTWTEGNRLWRKNRRNNGDGTFGVDLNRNWGYQWGGPGSSGFTGDEDYRGPFAFSEPETQVISGFIAANPNIVGYMDYHSYRELILWPWGYQDPVSPDEATFSLMGLIMQALIQGVHGRTYTAGPIYSTIYPVSGGSVDWVYGNQGRLAFSIEMRPASSNPGFILPPEEIIPNNEENLPAILFLADYATADIRITLPDGAPASIEPGVDTAITVRIEPGQQTPLPGTETMYYRYDAAGPYQSSAMTPLGGDLFAAVLPATNCLSQAEFYFSVEGDGGAIMTKPASAEETVFAATVSTDELLFADTFESDQGWLAAILGATSGQWQRGVPVNDPNWDYDPAADSDGSGQCYLTQNEAGNTDIDNGGVRLTSPTLNLSGGEVTIAYDYYLFLTQPGADQMVVEISGNDGAGPWTQIAVHGTNGGTSWRHHEISQSELDAAGVVLTATMRLRITASDNDPPSIVEAGLDAIQIIRPAPCAPITGDFNGDGTLTLEDHQALSECLSGPDNQHPPGCQVFDAEPDTDVDMRDVAEFMSGFAAR